MSGAKNFGVRSPPDPAVIHRPYPLPLVVPDSVEPPDRAAAGSTCCCRCRCSCTVPEQVALPAVVRSIPPQLLTPFPEPPVLRRPLPSATAPLARPNEVPAAPADGPSPLQIPTGPLEVLDSDSGPLHVSSDGTGPVHGPTKGPPKFTADDPSDRRAPTTSPGPGQTPACPKLRRRPAAAMFQGGEEDDHPYVRILDTPAPERPLLARYIQPISFGTIGFGSAFVFNLFAKKPLFAGIQRHLALGAAGCLAGVYITRWIESNSAERDAVLKHYIQLHPEDFPVPERKKFGEILQTWSPLR